MKNPLPIVFVLTLLMFGLAGEVQAERLVTVSALNYPVWMERGNATRPLSPGDDLLPGDLVRTGENGRVWLAMADGSVVKLGASTHFVIESAEYDRRPGQPVLTAALNVIKGAFRFTTSFFQPRRQTQHLVHIKVGAITAGLRGTDIWGRSAENEDFVILLDGSIVIDAKDDDSAVLSGALTRYLKKRGRRAEPLDVIDRSTLPSLAAHTELAEGLGIVDGSGAFELVLHSSRFKQGIERMVQRYQQRGYAVRSQPVDIDGEQYIRVVLPGIASFNSARKLAQRLEQEFGLQDIWVNNR